MPRTRERAMEIANGHENMMGCDCPKCNDLADLVQEIDREATEATVKVLVDRISALESEKTALEVQVALLSAITGQRPKSQGRCDTTETERFENPNCICKTYARNLGPCADHELGGNGRCCYCDHEMTCKPAIAGNGEGKPSLESRVAEWVRTHPQFDSDTLPMPWPPSPTPALPKLRLHRKRRRLVGNCSSCGAAPFIVLLDRAFCERCYLELRGMQRRVVEDFPRKREHTNVTGTPQAPEVKP